MTYKLKFLPSALKEWKKLDQSIKTQFKKKLSERLINPHVQAIKLHGLRQHYKIKLRTSRFRFVYEVIDDELYIMVIAVGKRDKGTIYNKMNERS